LRYSLPPPPPISAAGWPKRSASSSDGSKNATSLDRLFVTDIVPPSDLLQRKVEVLSIAPLLGTAIEWLHENVSLVELLEQ
jgi:phosphoribosylpyrophosphate synthetase